MWPDFVRDDVLDDFTDDVVGKLFGSRRRSGKLGEGKLLPQAVTNRALQITKRGLVQV